MLASKLAALLGAAWTMGAAAAAQCGTAKLASPDGAPGDELGSAVAIDGDRLVVGDDGDDDLGTASGSAFVFERGTGGWELSAHLFASDGEAFDYFGDAVAVAGGTVAVGAPVAEAVYVFEEVGGAWTETAIVTPSDPQGARFGGETALQGDRLVVGAPYHDGAGGADAGAVYVFERDPSLGWVELARLEASDGAAQDYLGEAVALDGDRIAAGARTHDQPFVNAGAVYVFERDAGGSWSETAKLVGSEEHDVFGEDVALAGDVLAVGSNQDSAPVYELAGGAWTLVDVLTQPDPSGGNDLFGWSVAVEGERVVVGARKNGAGVGAAYLFERAGAAYDLAGKLVHPDGSELFGGTVAMDGDDVVVGDRDAPSAASTSGAAFAFVLAGGAGLVGSPGTLAVDAGGEQDLALETCPPLPDAPYVVLGSLSGTSPGLPLGGGLVLPLNPDAYLFQTIADPSAPPLVGGAGTLDLAGRASATFVLPPGVPGLAGLTAHHAAVVLDPAGLPLVVSDAAALGLLPTKSVWTVDDDAPADFAEIADAIASPAVDDGHTLAVQPGEYADFALTKALRVLAAGEPFHVGAVEVRDVEAFTLAGVVARRLLVEDVSGRGAIDAARVGVVAFDPGGGFPEVGETTIRRCDELLITDSVLLGTDACYPEIPDAGHAVEVRDARVVLAGCEVRGGDGAGEGCGTHFPTSGAAVHALFGADLTSSGSTLVGGVGPFDENSPAILVGEAGVAIEVRGSSSDLLQATLPGLGIDGTPGVATVSGVTVDPPTLPGWVAQPAEPAPYLRAVPGAVEAYGVAGSSALVAAADEAALVTDLIPGLGPVWFDPLSLIGTATVPLAGQDVAATIPLPAGLPAPGATAIFQALVTTPGGTPYLTPPTQLVGGP